jgi:hypothetical protein
MKAARKRAQAIANGRGRDHRVVIPLAFEVAARISARPLDKFRNDPGQLANGLGELQHAINADGIVCALANEMELNSAAGQGLNADTIIASGPVAASLEACSRLRQSNMDEIVLLAGVTGPATLARQFGANLTAAGECFANIVKAFCTSGADVVMLFEDADTTEDDDWKAAVKTAHNIAHFYQASLLAWNSATCPMPMKLSLSAPTSNMIGFVTTDCLVTADEDIGLLQRWVRVARGE